MRLSSGSRQKGEVAESHVTCLMAVTVMTKKSGSPLVMGLVGVSIIS